MSQSISGQSRVPPGFRFHPTEEELLHYYLRKKVACEKIDLDVILEIDVNKLEPWDIEEKCKIGSTSQNEWYFFSHKDKKYPTGIRTNRATAAGFWKATGRDKVIYGRSKRIGLRKTLVFYMGRAPHGQKSDWILHEYRLNENADDNSQSDASSSEMETAEEAGWVVCRVFKKKTLLKTVDRVLPEKKTLDSSASKSSITQDHDNTIKRLNSSCRDGALEEILQYITGSCKMEIETNNTNCITYDLPELSSEVQGHAVDADATIRQQWGNGSGSPNEEINQKDQALGDWATIDRLVASHLNSNSDPFKQLDFFNLLHTNECDSDLDLWSFAQSSKNPPTDQ